MSDRDEDMTGAELRLIRTQCGMTLDQLGELVNVNGKTVRGWEMATGRGVPRDVADAARDLHTRLLSTKQDMLGRFADAVPGDEVTLNICQQSRFDGTVSEWALRNAAVGLAFHDLVDDGISVWVHWE